MKPYRLAALFVLSLTASFAYAGRDELLIQQTRKNQLAHDACVEKARHDQGRQQKPDAAPAQQPQR